MSQASSRVPRGGIGAFPRFDGPRPLPDAATDRPKARTDAPSELLFVDPSVPDLGTILANLRPRVEAIVLDARRPAARQIALALEGRDELDAMHIIAHGAPGRVSFAAGEWSAQTLEGDAEDLAAIGRALGEDNVLMVWSCYAGQGQAGRTFVGALARAVGVDVRAATKPVGSAALGGSWELAIRARMPPQPPLTGRGLEAYAGLLAGVHRIVSGDVPYDAAENVTYVVVSSTDKRVVASFSLPGHANIPRFSITVTVPSANETYVAGRVDESGKFIPANFTISEKSQFSVGGKDTREARHDA
ncbi:DUF4347 domain-containing protein [Mesorhizobium sp. ESP7-2]|uniref:DUF4347 domain-containing protein n=1 Tax=Mesorhizobium sp. ESP7-2 TaxID=2876622 RepID=UPI001CCDBC98|nr:DUF4347 domain-containing protein [Mesorhizobium sp. ESP7-2]MBZ9705580.1 DUF4347 domain-containing protein [Mesorhizobium sp. ESP7-2]